MKLMKEVKRNRDGIKKGHKKCKRGENASTAQRQLPLSGTLKDSLAPLRGEKPLRGRSGFKMNLMKEVKKDRDGIRKELKKWKRRKTVSTAQRQFTTERHSGTHVGSAEG
ncbi:hypothetical protein LR48_Vigan06g087800 [Vigna angularis]|uniref:Uncharacterized protein n=1 Tax=Phaseolus angularis TaxID=3914 RepID=A0A0L9USM3_PHAAN|nr:hypothetical protein LR48_Vigan06g087800 [Vigna angularis]